MNFGKRGNIKRYGCIRPPAYNLTNIEVPTYIHYGVQDIIVTQSVIFPMSRMFQKSTLKKVIIHEQFNHLDFLVSTESKKKVNDVIFQLIAEYENGLN